MKNILKKLHTPTWLFVLLLVVLILRIPSFFEPYSYGDELIYLTLGEAIRQGIPLYRGIHDNKPPLLYILAAVAGNLFVFKAILSLWHLVTVFIFWKLTEFIFPKKVAAQKVATVIFALLTTLPLLEGNIINAELFMVGPTILAFYILLSKKITPKTLLTSGMLFSISTLFKVPAAFDVPTIVLFWIVSIKQIGIKDLRTVVKNTFILVVGFAAPIFLTFVFYFFQGTIREYVIAAFLQNVGYLSSWRPTDVQKPFLEKNLPLLVRVAIVTVGSVILYIKRIRLSKEFVFATLWLLMTFFAVTLSERPYPHYLIQSVPPVSLLLAILFTDQTKMQTMTIIPLTLAFLTPVYFKFWYYPTTPYYTRFIKLVVGQISKEQYLASFGSQVPRNYKVANFIQSSTKSGDKIFVWGDSSPIYALSRRFPPIKYVADYHIRDFSSNDEVGGALLRDMPYYIIVLPDSPSLPTEINRVIEKYYGALEDIDGAKIWKLFNPRVRALISP